MIAAAVVPLLWVFGVLVGRRRRRIAAAHRARSVADARRAVDQERLRVARDLHDVVAHHVSAVAVQAGAARVATDPAAVAQACAHIAESGRRIAAALPELAGLTPDPDAVALTADGVAQLLAPVRAAGLPATAQVHGDPPARTGDAEIFAQRVLVEALTNALRHAGPTPTDATVTHTAARVTVTVVDYGPVPGHRRSGVGSGLGLVGMRERAALLGGRVDAGPHGRGWRVHADLPRPLLPEEDIAPAEMSSSSPTRPTGPPS